MPVTCCTDGSALLDSDAASREILLETATGAYRRVHFCPFCGHAFTNAPSDSTRTVLNFLDGFRRQGNTVAAFNSAKQFGGTMLVMSRQEKIRITHDARAYNRINSHDSSPPNMISTDEVFDRRIRIAPRIGPLVIDPSALWGLLLHAGVRTDAHVVMEPDYRTDNADVRRRLLSADE